MGNWWISFFLMGNLRLKFFIDAIYHLGELMPICLFFSECIWFIFGDNYDFSFVNKMLYLSSFFISNFFGFGAAESQIVWASDEHNYYFMGNLRLNCFFDAIITLENWCLDSSFLLLSHDLINFQNYFNSDSFLMIRVLLSLKG